MMIKTQNNTLSRTSPNNNTAVIRNNSSTHSMVPYSNTTSTPLQVGGMILSAPNSAAYATPTVSLFSAMENPDLNLSTNVRLPTSVNNEVTVAQITAGMSSDNFSAISNIPKPVKVDITHSNSQVTSSVGNSALMNYCENRGNSNTKNQIIEIQSRLEKLTNTLNSIGYKLTKDVYNFYKDYISKLEAHDILTGASVDANRINKYIIVLQEFEKSLKETRLEVHMQYEFDRGFVRSSGPRNEEYTNRRGSTDGHIGLQGGTVFPEGAPWENQPPTVQHRIHNAWEGSKYLRDLLQVADSSVDKIHPLCPIARKSIDAINQVDKKNSEKIRTTAEENLTNFGNLYKPFADFQNEVKKINGLLQQEKYFNYNAGSILKSGTPPLNGGNGTRGGPPLTVPKALWDKFLTIGSCKNYFSQGKNGESWIAESRSGEDKIGTPMRTLHIKRVTDTINGKEVRKDILIHFVPV